MRALLVIAALSSSMMADPVSTSDPVPARAAVRGTPGSAFAGEPWHAYVPADRGGFSGIVIAPTPIPDALPYPRGLVIAPPEIGDRMGNVLTRPWWRRLGDGLDTIWNALQSHTL
jgi:hypothetical protein